MKLGLLLVLGVSTSLCFADTEAQARKSIEKIYARMSAAFAAKDAKGFEAVFADDFSAKNAGRPVMKRAELIKDFEGQMKMMSDVHWNQTIQTFELRGNKAHVHIATKMSAKAPGQDGKPHAFLLTSKTINDWEKGAKGWQVRYSETADLKMWMDGKPLGRGR